MNAPAKIAAETIHSAMANAFAEIEGATKSANNPHFKTKYADLTSVIEAIKPALTANGLFFTQCPTECSGGVQIKTYLHHRGGENLFLGELFVPANKNDAQSYGSALTYARRYALVTAFGVPVEDDDGNAAARGSGDNASNGKVSPGPAITDAQLGELELLIPAAQLTVAQFNQTMGCQTVKQLPAAKFSEAKERLQTRMAELAKKATDAKAKETA